MRSSAQLQAMPVKAPRPGLLVVPWSVACGDADIKLLTAPLELNLRSLLHEPIAPVKVHLLVNEHKLICAAVTFSLA